MKLDYSSWGYRRDMKVSDVIPIQNLLQRIASTISCNGNILINVGPTKDGTIDPLFEERLRQMGSWLQVNGEAVYKSRPWTFQNDTVTPGVWYTQRTDETTPSNKNVYAFVFTWPENTLVLGAPVPSATTQVTLLGFEGQFKFSQRSGGVIIINIPVIPFNKMPCDWLWVFKITNPQN